MATPPAADWEDDRTPDMIEAMVTKLLAATGQPTPETTAPFICCAFKELNNFISQVMTKATAQHTGDKSIGYFDRKFAEASTWCMLFYHACTVLHDVLERHHITKPNTFNEAVRALFDNRLDQLAADFDDINTDFPTPGDYTGYYEVVDEMQATALKIITHPQN